MEAPGARWGGVGTAAAAAAVRAAGVGGSAGAVGACMRACVCACIRAYSLAHVLTRGGRPRRRLRSWCTCAPCGSRRRSRSCASRRSPRRCRWARRRLQSKCARCGAPSPRVPAVRRAHARLLQPLEADEAALRAAAECGVDVAITSAALQRLAHPLNAHGDTVRVPVRRLVRRSAAGLQPPLTAAAAGLAAACHNRCRRCCGQRRAPSSASSPLPAPSRVLTLLRPHCGPDRCGGATPALHRTRHAAGGGGSAPRAAGAGPA